MSSTESLVIGAGPVGLAAALHLLERGVETSVIDAGGMRELKGYACGLHCGTLRSFERLALMPALSEVAHRVDRLSIRHAGGAPSCVDFSSITDGFPYALTLRQTELEELLEEAVVRRGGQMLRRQAVTALTPRDGFVRVTTRPCLGGRNEAASEAPGVTHDASYVLGADGYFSFCRRTLGIEQLELRAPRAFAIYDFFADLSDVCREAQIVLGAAGVSAFWPLGSNLGRWTFEVGDHLDEAPTLESLHQLLREQAPWFAPRPEQLCWGAVAPFEHRIARSAGSGRVWLAGDAAHCTSPIGFQSMNRGFHEAEALAQLIANALLGEHVPGQSFADFERAEHTEWHHLFGVDADLRPLPSRLELTSSLPATGAAHRSLQARLT